MPYLTDSELRQLGLKDFGERVRISTRASLYGAAHIALGSDVRIDDFCVLSAGAGGIRIGSFVHLGVACTLIGRARIELGDFAGLSARVAVYSSSDDYSGESLTNPTVPEAFSAVQHAEVIIGRHVIVGAGAVILPGATIGQGAAIGALTLVTKPCAEFGVYFGAPARKIGERKRTVLELERQLAERLQRKG